jgi:hypothetical protein
LFFDCGLRRAASASMYKRSRGVTLSRSDIAFSIASRARMAGESAAPPTLRAISLGAVESLPPGARPPSRGSRKSWNAGR